MKLVTQLVTQPLAGVILLSVYSLASTSHPANTGANLPQLRRTVDGGIQIPIWQHNSPELGVSRRAEAIGLGDFQDITYNVLISVGGTVMPVVLDTGSADLWVLSDACQSPDCASPTSSLPQARTRYPQSSSSFKPANLDALLLYGDSRTGTMSSGPIGSDIVGIGIAGDTRLTLGGQYFAAINRTTTKVLQTGSTGIFGLGFPLNSAMWNQLFTASRTGTLPTTNTQPNARRTNPPNAPFFPSLKPPSTLSPRQSAPTTLEILSSYNTLAPLLPRLVLSNALLSPMFTVSLQRNAIDVGGNVGMLTIGGVPEGVDESQIAWVDVRRYGGVEGGLGDSSGASGGEVYPLAWEIPIEDVYLDGHVLPRSTLADPSIVPSALIDTGNSLIRGPADTIAAILALLNPSSSSRISCTTPHVLSFKIGGKLFPVDPRDLITQASSEEDGKALECAANLVVTDTPKSGGGVYLYAWNLGSPFLRGVLASFHYGNITHPSSDSPRIGLLSTVPDDASAQFMGAVNAASDAHGFPVTENAAPDSTPVPAGINPGGVGQASQTRTARGSMGTLGRSGNGVVRKSAWGAAGAGVGAVVFLAGVVLF